MVVSVLPSRSNGYDDRLAQRLASERRRNGNNRAFYKGAAWRALRAQILARYHGECVDCLAKSPAIYTPATCVHHEAHVDTYPGWALSETYIDSKGIEHANLVPLCHECHDIRHGRWQGHTHDTSRDVTEERW